jgi:hypothetical protein
MKVRGASTMRTSAPRPETAAVSLDLTHRVVVDLVAGPGPIAGTLHDEGGVSRAFSGWLELCARREAARASEEPQDGREAVLP